MSEQFDEIFDVLVIGSGCGGLTAALTADISNPAKVLVIEKSPVSYTHLTLPTILRV